MADLTEPFFKIEVRHIRYFIAAAQHGSFRKAGMQIGIKESGISRCMNDLENRLGALLFHRYSGGVCLTAAGRRFLERALRIVRDVSDGMRDVALIGQGHTGLLKVGIVSSLSGKFTGKLMREFKQHYSGILLDFTEGEPAEHIASISRLEIDIAFVPAGVSLADCKTAPLWQEMIYAVLPQDHDLANQEVIEWKDLVNERLALGRMSLAQEIRERFIRHTTAFIHSPSLDLRQISQCNLLALVEIERFITLVDESFITTQLPGVVYRPIKDEIVQIGVAWISNNKNPSIPHLLRCATNVASRLDVLG